MNVSHFPTQRRPTPRKRVAPTSTIYERNILYPLIFYIPRQESVLCMCNFHPYIERVRWFFTWQIESEEYFWREDFVQLWFIWMLIRVVHNWFNCIAVLYALCAALWFYRCDGWGLGQKIRKFIRKLNIKRCAALEKNYIYFIKVRKVSGMIGVQYSIMKLFRSQFI